MVHPDTPKALRIAEGLDENHIAAAIENGAETGSKIEQRIKEAAERHMAHKALVETAEVA